MARSKSSILLLVLLMVVTGMVIVRAATDNNQVHDVRVEQIHERDIYFDEGDIPSEREIAEIKANAMEAAHEALSRVQENSPEFAELHESLAELRENLKSSLNIHVEVEALADEFVMVEQSFDVSNGEYLDINIPASDVEITTNSGDVAKIVYLVKSTNEEKAREFFDRINFEARKSGNTVSLEGKMKSRSHWKTRSKGVLKVSIPSQFNVDAKTSGGDISLGDLEGQLDLKTSGGDVTIGNTKGSQVSIKTSGGDINTNNVEFDTIQIETSGGSINLDSVEGRSVEVRTSGGDIVADEVNGSKVILASSGGDLEIDSISGDLEARTSGGDIEIGLNGNNPANLRTSGGDIRIIAPSDLAANVKLTSSEVKIDSKFQFSGEKSKRRAEGTINGGGPQLTAQTSGGSIRLRVK